MLAQSKKASQLKTWDAGKLLKAVVEKAMSRNQLYDLKASLDDRAGTTERKNKLNKKKKSLVSQLFTAINDVVLDKKSRAIYGQDFISIAVKLLQRPYIARYVVRLMAWNPRRSVRTLRTAHRTPPDCCAPPARSSNGTI